MKDLIEFLSSPLAQRSLWACGVVGFTDGFLSALVLLRRSSLQIGTISCALLPGIALGILLFGLGRWSVLAGAVLAGLLVGLSSLFVSRSARFLHQDAALSVIHSFAFAAGYIVLMRMGLQQKVDDWLFGNIMSMGDTDLWIAYMTGALAILLITAFSRPLIIFLFDSRAAAALGLPSRALSYGIFALIILALVSSLQAVGAFLTLGLLVAPAATMRFFSRRPASLFWGGGLVGASCGILAFLLSFLLRWHLGATMVLLLGLAFLASFALSRLSAAHSRK